MDEKDFGAMRRSGSYPVQTTEFTPHPERPPETRAENNHPRLPKSIRALKDARDSAQHPRTVVICLDGTGDRFDADNSNVVHFVSCLKKHSPTEQVTYYQSGIGTYDKGGLSNGIGAAMDMAVGSGLGVHIKDAYQFLMQHYREGDRICLFGFSRGAYTVRCLAGMLHKVGLLPASNGSQVNFAYNFYKDDSDEGWDMSRLFKKTFCTDVNVYFVGVWDCVASVGFIPRMLPFSKSPTNSVRHFRHAMALDERRAKFKVCHWQQNPDLVDDLKRRATIDNTPTARLKRSGIFSWSGFKSKPTAAQTNGTAQPNGIARSGNILNKTVSDNKKSERQDALQAKFDAQDEENRRHRKVKPDVLEVWFMGAHADVGGGAVKNTERHMLSRIPLRWMIRQCFECDTGMLFDSARLAEQGLDMHTLWPVYQAPSKPAVGPPPSLLEKYENGTLAPLDRRSTFLRMGPENRTIKDAPTAEDLRYILPSESTETHFDAMAEANDQLVQAKGWWILEFWPVKIRVLDKEGEGWVKKVSLNRGRYRAVRETEPKLHWTVRHMVNEGKYNIKARVERNMNWREVA